VEKVKMTSINSSCRDICKFYNFRRADDETALETSSSVTLAPLWVEDAVIGLEAKMPAHGWVRTPFCISYFIKNHSDYLITLRLAMEGSDAFMFAGQKQVCFFLLYLYYSLYTQ